jgi:hypothetical protein
MVFLGKDPKKHSGAGLRSNPAEFGFGIFLAGFVLEGIFF